MQIQKRRANELYAKDSPFRQKVVKVKTLYTRKQKHKTKELLNLFN